MQTIARISAAALLFACALVANAANPGTLLVLNKSDNTVSLVDLASKKSVATIPTGSAPHEVAVSPDGRTAVVCNYGSQLSPGSTLTVIDIPARKSTRTIDLQQYRRPHDIAWLRGNEVAVTTDQREVWATNRGGDTVSIIDVGSSKIVATVASKSFPIRAKFTDDGKHVLVSNAQSGDVAVFDAASRREVQRIRMQSDASSQGPVPVGILIVPALSRAFVANTNADTVTVIDLKTWQIVDRLTAGREPYGLGYSPLTL